MHSCNCKTFTDTYEMLVEDSERGIRFVVPHHYEGSVRGAGDLCTSRRMKRLAQEAVTLSTSLPLSYSSSVFVRTDLDRLDIMKVCPSRRVLVKKFDVLVLSSNTHSCLVIKINITFQHLLKIYNKLGLSGKLY